MITPNPSAPDRSQSAPLNSRSSGREVIKSLAFAIAFGAVLGPFLLFPPLSWQALLESIAAGAAFFAGLYLLSFAIPNALVVASTVAGAIAGAAWSLPAGPQVRPWVAALWGAALGLFWAVIEARVARKEASS